MWKALAINIGESQSLMAAVVVRRLRDQHKWTPREIETVADKAITLIERKAEEESMLASLAKDAAIMHSGGASTENIQTMANAAFAIIGVQVADDLHRSRIAESN